MPKEQTRPSFPDADKVVLCCDFIDHGWENAAIAQFGTDRVLRHKGGITTLISLLNTIVR